MAPDLDLAAEIFSHLDNFSIVLYFSGRVLPCANCQVLVTLEHERQSGRVPAELE